MSGAYRMSRAYRTSRACRSQLRIFTLKNQVIFNMCNMYLNWRGQKLTILQPQLDSGEFWSPPSQFCCHSSIL